MAGLYHINGDSVSPCKAQKGKCPFGQGDENNHFSDPAEAMNVLETRLSQEYGAVGPAVNKNPIKTAKELASEGASPKEIRDALRRENPDWGARRVHTVQSTMTKEGQARGMAPKTFSGKDKAMGAGPHGLTETQVKNKLKDISDSAAKEKELFKKLSELDKEINIDNLSNGVKEGRAYYYSSSGKIPGVNPNGRTFYENSPELSAKRKDLYDKIVNEKKKREGLQTEIELSGNGHKLADEGNTVRVRTQEQKWLLKDELQGQISDGHWENSNTDAWKEWSGAKVIVDPKNPGRNFHTSKDNYQLNSRALLDAVGDRMVENVRDKTGITNYNDKTMYQDLKDLRTIFKTHRPKHEG